MIRQDFTSDTTTPLPPPLPSPLLSHTGNSPFRIKGAEEGKHSILVIAKRKGFFGTRRFDFEVLPDVVEQLELELTQMMELEDGSVPVSMRVTGTIRGQLRLMCSLDGGDFAPCECEHEGEEWVGGGGVQSVKGGCNPTFVSGIFTIINIAFPSLLPPPSPRH